MSFDTPRRIIEQLFITEIQKHMMNVTPDQSGNIASLLFKLRELAKQCSVDIKILDKMQAFVLDFEAKANQYSERRNQFGSMPTLERMSSSGLARAVSCMSRESSGY